MKRMSFAWLVAAVTLALAACSGGSGEADNAAEPVALVTLATAERGAVARELTLYGAAEPGPAGRIALVAPAEGTLVSVDAPAGTPVRRGQVVARLSPSPTTRLDLAKATSDATAADLALARARRLRADGLGSDAEVETARAAARSADVTRTSLAARAGGLTVRASADGVVDSVTPSPGDLVAAGGAVALISRSADARARFGVDPAAARALRPGQSLRIAANAGRPALTLPIESVSPMVDSQTRLVSVFARLPAGAGIGAGASLTATVATEGGGDAVTVPYAALLDDAGQPYVFVVAGGAAHRRDVTVGAAAGEQVAVGGVHAGERVVVQGGTAVEDGMKVRTR